MKCAYKACFCQVCAKIPPSLISSTFSWTELHRQRNLNLKIGKFEQPCFMYTCTSIGYSPIVYVTLILETEVKY